MDIKVNIFNNVKKLISELDNVENFKIGLINLKYGLEKAIIWLTS